jgi:hypothetical protein
MVCSYRLVIKLRAEADGDLHIALQDPAGDKAGSVVAQISAKPRRSTFISRAGKNSRDQTNLWREDCRMNQYDYSTRALVL